MRDRIPNKVKVIYRDIRRKIFDPAENSLIPYLYPDTLTIRHNGEKMVFDTSSPLAKRWFYPRYRDGSLHEPVVSTTLFNHLDSDSIFLDIGANVGFYTVMTSHRASEIHSFEMDPRLVSIIRSHFNQNTPAQSATKVIPAAVGETSGGFVSFSPHMSGNLSTNMIHSENQKNIQSQFRIPTVALDDYTMSEDIEPSVLKIDVEGEELAVLQGMTKTLKNYEPILFLEVHPHLLETKGESVDEVLSFLKEYDYSFQVFTDRRSKIERTGLEDMNNSIPFNENKMLLCSTRE
jgi:FkbM family methyltransferase